MRTDSNSELRIFDRTTRLMHWLTAGFMLLVFVLAFSIDLATSRSAHIAFLQLHRSIARTDRQESLAGAAAVGGTEGRWLLVAWPHCRARVGRALPSFLAARR